jgi:oligopeptide/dipeptide ABC transporter ATP-binding protein
MDTLIRVSNLRKYFPLRGGLLRKEKGFVHAVDGVDFDIGKGQTLGLVGESGCGKTTTGRVILRLYEPTDGAVYFNGRNIFEMNRTELKKLRSKMQIVFQDPFASLNPRKTIRKILSQPYILHKLARKGEIEDKVAELLETVGITPAQKYMDRFPHEFSGGQRQRIGIARAISLNPEFLVADEPVASLDLSVRSQILTLMRKLQKNRKLAYLFITHDLAVVRSMADRVAVMYLGKIVEMAEVKEIYLNTFHPYTRALLSAVPRPNPKLTQVSQRILLKGDVPSPVNPPSGCRFHPRCSQAKEICREREPPTVAVEPGHTVSCWLYE